MIVGHSVGEVSAAYRQRMLSLEDAVKVSYHRAWLQAGTAGAGGMLAVAPSEAEVRVDHRCADLCIAAVNGPSGVTLAGAHSAIADSDDELTSLAVFARRLQVEVPYHCHLMDPILSKRPGRSLTGPAADTCHAAVLDGVLPRCHRAGLGRGLLVRERPPAGTVRRRDRLLIAAAGHRVFLEVGPHPVLSGYIKELLIRTGEPFACIATLSRGDDDEMRLRQAVGELYVAGVVDASSGAGITPHVQLPRYPWQKTRQWFEPGTAARDRTGAATFPMLGEPTDAGAPEWQVQLAAEALSWLPDHIVDDKVVLPGAAYLDAALSAAASRAKTEDLAVEDVKFLAPLVIQEHDIPVVRFSMEESTKRFAIHARHDDDAGWTLHATGRLVEGRVTPCASTFPAQPGRRWAATNSTRSSLLAGCSTAPRFSGLSRPPSEWTRWSPASTQRSRTPHTSRIRPSSMRRFSAWRRLPARIASRVQRCPLRSAACADSAR